MKTSQNNKIKDQRYHHQLKCSRVSRDTAHTHGSFHHHYIVILSFDGKVTERAFFLFPSFFFCCVVSIDAVEPKGKTKENKTKKVDENIFEISAVYVLQYASADQLQKKKKTRTPQIRNNVKCVGNRKLSTRRFWVRSRPRYFHFFGISPK